MTKSSSLEWSLQEQDRLEWSRQQPRMQLCVKYYKEKSDKWWN